MIFKSHKMRVSLPKSSIPLLMTNKSATIFPSSSNLFILDIYSEISLSVKRTHSR